MRKLHAQPLVLTLVAFALAAGAVLGIALGYGPAAFAAWFDHPHSGWLVLALLAAPLAHLAYAAAYRAVAEADGAPDLVLPLVFRLVLAGFGPFTLRGGFALDRRALEALHEDEGGALARMLGLGSLEWLLLAPIVCAAAIVLLVAGDARAQGSMVWPWALAVPAGFALGAWLVLPRQRRRIARGGRLRSAIARGLSSVDILLCLGRGLRSGVAAFGGMALYWALDISAFYAAARFIGLSASVGEAIIAYGTGYALTRRSMPFGGAGVTEVLMTFSLHWMGQPVPGALAAVLVYRAVTFALPTVPALLVRPRITPLLRASEEGRGISTQEHRVAAAPLRPPSLGLRRRRRRPPRMAA